MTLPERLIELHRALTRRKLPHAFGGAIALAYWTLDPRGTSDIDVADCRDLRPRHVGGERAQVAGAHDAESDDADPQGHGSDRRPDVQVACGRAHGVSTLPWVLR